MKPGLGQMRKSDNLPWFVYACTIMQDVSSVPINQDMIIY